MMEKKQLEFSEAAERTPLLRNNIEKFIESIGADRGLEKEVERIIGEEQLAGFGRAAKVFELSSYKSPCNLCVKIWRNKPKRELTFFEYKKIQWLDPKEEFKMQDKLYLAGCDVPRPVFFGNIGDRDVLVMEQVKGYNLGQIMEAGAKITSPNWKNLEKSMAKIKNLGIVHRDLRPENIMLKTDDGLGDGAELSGKIFIIDFGLAKDFHNIGDAEDAFRERIGGFDEDIIYIKDMQNLNDLNPKTNRKKSPFKN